jgi:hypothetical protein
MLCGNFELIFSQCNYGIDGGSAASRNPGRKQANADHERCCSTVEERVG